MMEQAKNNKKATREKKKKTRKKKNLVGVVPSLFVLLASC